MIIAKNSNIEQIIMINEVLRTVHVVDIQEWTMNNERTDSIVCKRLLPKCRVSNFVFTIDPRFYKSFPNSIGTLEILNIVEEPRVFFADSCDSWHDLNLNVLRGVLNGYRDSC